MNLKYETFTTVEAIEDFISTLMKNQLVSIDTVAIKGPEIKQGDCIYQTPDLFRVWFWDGVPGERIPHG